MACGCGCGQDPGVYERSRPGRGAFKGAPRKFVPGHAGRPGGLATRYQPKSAEPYAAEDRGFSSPCWIWLRGISDTGYGTARLNGRVMGAHRAYYIERHGPIPEGLHLDHLCRVRACVNPDHLEPVTPAVNAERGTGKTLTPEQIAEGARLRHEEGATFVELGERFGVHPATMLRAIRRYGTGRAA